MERTVDGELKARAASERVLAGAALALVALSLALHLGSSEARTLASPFWLKVRSAGPGGTLFARYDPSRRDLRFLLAPPNALLAPSQGAAGLLFPESEPVLDLNLGAAGPAPQDWPEAAAPLVPWSAGLRPALRLALRKSGRASRLGPYARALLVLEALNLPAGERPVALLPGSVKKNAYVPDEGLARILRSRYLSPAEASGRVTVEVLNGSGVEGLATRATELLRKNGLDVVNWGNAPQVCARTRLFDRQGDRRAALRARAALRVGLPVLTELQNWSQADATVVLGQDFRLPR